MTTQTITDKNTENGSGETSLSDAIKHSPLGEDFVRRASGVTRHLAVELAFVWDDFVRRLERVPIVVAIESGTADASDYRRLLLNLRQQVVEGGRWIARTASSMSAEYFAVRSALIVHAAEEHRDYQMLEADYVAAGGELAEIQSASKNVGSEALSAYIFFQAGRPDPLHLFGAMFIIEGLGVLKATHWAGLLREHAGLDETQTRFLAYHGEGDDEHFEKLRRILSAPFITPEVAAGIVKTAKVVARLYALQLEELDNV